MLKCFQKQFVGVLKQTHFDQIIGSNLCEFALLAYHSLCYRRHQLLRQYVALDRLDFSCLVRHGRSNNGNGGFSVSGSSSSGYIVFSPFLLLLLCAVIEEKYCSNCI